MLQNKHVLKVSNISKTFPGVKALNKVKFELLKGEVHALCGENGAGKSTLMHILAGIYRPDEGNIEIDGLSVKLKNQVQAQGLGISIVFQERSLSPNLSVAENIFAGSPPVKRFGNVNWQEMYQNTGELLKELGLEFSPKVLAGDLTPAQQQMVEIAKALSRKAKVLILDEPTSTITTVETEALFRVIERLKKEGVGIIYISHRLTEIEQIADRVTVLKDGCYIGTHSLKEITIDHVVNLMVGRELADAYHFAGEQKDSRVIFELKGLSGQGFNNVNLELKEGEIIALAGLAGAGRTELALAIFGASPLETGEVWLEGKKLQINSPFSAMAAGIGYLPEDRKELGLFLNMSVAENIAAANLKKCSSGLFIDDNEILKYAEEYRKKMGIATPSVNQLVANLSGGNQQKVGLSKWLLRLPKVLIVDEPTRGVDVGAKAEIYKTLRQLAQAGVSIIVISSELLEILAMGERIFVMCEGRITGNLERNEATEEKIMLLASGLQAS